MQDACVRALARPEQLQRVWRKSGAEMRSGMRRQSRCLLVFGFPQTSCHSPSPYITLICFKRAPCSPLLPRLDIQQVSMLTIKYRRTVFFFFFQTRGGTNKALQRRLFNFPEQTAEELEALECRDRLFSPSGHVSDGRPDLLHGSGTPCTPRTPGVRLPERRWVNLRFFFAVVQPGKARPPLGVGKGGEGRGSPPRRNSNVGGAT